MSTQSRVHTSTIQVPRKLNFLGFISAAYSVWRQRRALSQLDPSALKDIGVTLGEAHLEAIKPVWNVPQHWLR